MWSWNEKTSQGKPRARDFEQGCRAMRVCFEYLPQWEDFEMRKWKVAQQAEDRHQSQVLVGLRRVQAVKEVSLALSKLGKDGSADSLAKWFESGQVRGMSSKVVSAMLKISNRFEAAGHEATLLVMELDSMYNVGHTLAHSSNLDALCQKTGCRSNKPLENSLLIWCLSMFVADVQAGKLSPDIGLPTLKQVLGRYLLRRRVVFYLTKKFGVKECPEWHNTFALVASFKQSGLASLLPSSLSLSWMQTLPEHCQTVLAFASKVMRGTDQLDALMDACLKIDPLCTPEAGVLQVAMCVDITSIGFAVSPLAKAQNFI